VGEGRILFALVFHSAVSIAPAMFSDPYASQYYCMYLRIFPELLSNGPLIRVNLGDRDLSIDSEVDFSTAKMFQKMRVVETGISSQDFEFNLRKTSNIEAESNGGQIESVRDVGGTLG